MMLMKYVTSSIEPVKILFDKKNIPITDLLVYTTGDINFNLYVIHKNQIKYTHGASLKTIRKEYSDGFDFYMNLLVVEHNILRKNKFCDDFSFCFREAPCPKNMLCIFLGRLS